MAYKFHSGTQASGLMHTTVETGMVPDLDDRNLSYDRAVHWQIRVFKIKNLSPGVTRSG